VLDHTTDPVMLVGPRARLPCASDAPVVVAVDGAAADLALVEVAVSWAATLSTPLIIITVAEPAPVSYREGRPRHWARGPADPEGRVAALAARAKATWPGCTVDTRVAHDPISMRDGLVRLLDRTAALLVTGSHRRSLPMRSLLGSHAARVVHDFAIPALVVPLDAGGHRSGS
jgi:nucleotide-binding universal stress UspA family protein